MEEDVRAAAAGDRRAFTRLVERHRGAVCAVALGITGDVVTSEDVAQEVFVNAWRVLSSLRDPDAFRGWLLESTRNRARDLVRARASRPAGSPAALDAVPDPAPSVTEQMADREDVLRIEASLAALPEDDREVLALYYREGQRLSEVAQQLGISEDAARQRLSRARRRLQADVEERLSSSLARTTPGAAFLQRVDRALPAVPPAIPPWIVGGAIVAGIVALSVLVVPGLVREDASGPARTNASAEPERRAATSGATVASERELRNAFPTPRSGRSSGDAVPAPSPARVEDAQEAPGTDREATTIAAAGERVELSLVVAFTGPQPMPRKIKKTPECGSQALVDEEVRVKDGRLANVLVRVIEGAPPVEGVGQGVEVVQEQCVYSPRISGIVAGQSIAITSKDNFLHNVHTFKGDVSIFNKGQPAPGTFTKEAGDFVVNAEPLRDGPITFRCDVHPWMVSHVVVNPNPYFAVTGADGTATIRVPPGRYKLEAWHEKFGVKTALIDTNASAVAFEYSGQEGRQ